MTLSYDERASDSPYVESITQGYTIGNGTVIRPAEVHWHMVLARYEGGTNVVVVGPLLKSGLVTFTEGVEILWIKFKLGTCIPYFPAQKLLDKETVLPEAASKSFWLNGTSWQFPDFENADTFIDRLVRNEVLARDSVVQTALQGHSQEISPRTVRHRFLRTTGLTQIHIRQFERAQYAANLLRQGHSILDTVFDAGYFDQPHLTRALKHWIGYTPAQIVRMARPSCDFPEDNHLLLEDDSELLAIIR